MEDIEDLLHNDTEAKFLALQNRKKKRKKRRRRIQLIVMIVVILLGIFYFSSNASKVKSLAVNGNIYYTKDEVLKKAGLSYNTRYIVVPKFYIEWKLDHDDLIEEVQIEKQNQAITLYVKEKTIIGYFVEKDKNKLLLSDGTNFDIASKNLTSIANYPLIDGFQQDQLENLGKSFASMKSSVAQEMISMISEIHPYRTSYDQNMIKLIMQDGNEIYSDYASVPLLKDYKNVVLKHIKKGTKKKICVVMDENTASLHTEDCKEFT